MIDAALRKTIDPPLNAAAKYLAANATANQVTVFGFVIGLGVIPALLLAQPALALLAVAINRVCDGLDGALARRQGITNLGGYLDIVLDFIFYSAVVFAVSLTQPDHAIYGAWVIFSFIGTGSAFLAYAIFAERLGISTEIRGKKSLYYLGGLTEGFETIVFLVAIIVLPHLFTTLCLIFGCLCWVTTATRIYIATRTLT